MEINLSAVKGERAEINSARKVSNDYAQSQILSSVEPAGPSYGKDMWDNI